MIIQPEAIKKKLSKFNERERNQFPSLSGTSPDKPEPAAVLIPFVKDNSVWKLLFIKRTSHPEDRHGGQIAFPGGRVDQDDQTLLTTALREAEEEIGINPVDVDILGRSRPITTVTNFRISPYVGILPWPYQLKLSDEEVQKSFLIPLEWLNDPNHRQEKTWQSNSHPGEDLAVFFFDEFEGEVLWGATAQMVIDLLNLIQLSPSG